MAFCRWVSYVSFQAGTLGHVVENIADSIDAASSRARVFALLVDASPVGWAFTIEDTHRSAREVRITLEAGQAFAGSSSPEFRTLGIVSTRIVFAWADHWLRCRSC